jgi:hypothetical protein
MVTASDNSELEAARREVEVLRRELALANQAIAELEAWRREERQSLGRLSFLHCKRSDSGLYPCNRNNALYVEPCDGCNCTRLP